MAVSTRAPTVLAGVELGLFDGPTAGTPVAGFGTCVSDADGDCSFVVPETDVGGANRDARFYVRQITAPAPYSPMRTIDGPQVDDPELHTSAYASVELNLNVRNQSIAQLINKDFQEIITNDCRQITEADFFASTGLLKRFFYYLS